MKTLIKTEIPYGNIDGRLIVLNRHCDGVYDAPAMLEVWPQKDGIIVTAVKPYDTVALTLSGRPHEVTEYGDLTQEEFDRYFQRPHA